MEQKKKSLFGLIKESLTQTGGCCGPGESCCGPSDTPSKAKDQQKNNAKTENKK